MMVERWLVIGIDDRMKQLAKKLTAPHRTVFYKNTSSWNAQLNSTVLEFHPDHIVLPIQPLSIDAPILIGNKNVKFYAGRLTEQWRSLLKNQEVHMYLQDEEFIWKNAGLTAEGLLAFFYEKGESVRGKTFIITGFGRVAKMLAQLLKSLHANVTIAVRSDTQLNEAKALGYDAIDLQTDNIHQANAIINTIPAQWLTQSFSDCIHMPIYDVASAPGCLYYVTRRDYTLLPALPGKYFADDAANVLFETITRGGD